MSYLSKFTSVNVLEPYKRQTNFSHRACSTSDTWNPCPRRWRPAHKTGLEQRRSKADFFPFLLKALQLSQPVNACNPSSALHTAEHLFARTAWMSINRERAFVPVRKNSGAPISGWRTMAKMATSVSGDLITTAAEPFCTAWAACNRSRVSASSCVHVSAWTSIDVTDTPSELLKGELNPEMKLCELLVFGHCIHLPLIYFPVPPLDRVIRLVRPCRLIFVTSLTQRWLGTLLRFEVFWTFIEKYSFDRSRLPVCLSLPYYACLVKIWRANLPWKLT